MNSFSDKKPIVNKTVPEMNISEKLKLSLASTFIDISKTRIYL